jgi:hypothetical protein
MLDAVSVAPELEAALLPTFRHPERLDQLWVGHPVVGPFGEVKRQVRQQGGLRLQKSPAARVRRVATHRTQASAYSVRWRTTISRFASGTRSEGGWIRSGSSEPE